jgi:small-conductance mechanosensitive channel
MPSSDTQAILAHPSALKSFAKTNTVQVVVKVILLVASCFVAYKFWSHPFLFCKAGNDKCEKIQQKQQLSSILSISFRLSISLLIVFQVMHLLNIKISPFLATLGVALAAIGFAMQQPIQDYTTGMIFALSERWQIGDTVYLSLHGQADKKGPYRITDLLMFGMELEDLEGQILYYRYSVIDGFEKYSN